MATANTVTTTIGVGSNPWRVAVNPTNGNVYVTNFDSNSISVIDGSSNTVTASIAVGVSPYDVAVNPNNGKVYVTNFNSGFNSMALTVIDGLSNTVIASIDVEGAKCVAVNPSNGKIYVTTGSTLALIDGSSNRVTSTINLGGIPYDLAINPISGDVYVTNLATNSVAVIDGLTNSVTKNIDVGAWPLGVTFNPGTGYIYVANADSNTMTVIDASKGSVVETVPVGNYPLQVAVNPNTNIVYVANASSHSVTVVDGMTNTVVDSIIIGDYPYGIDINPNTGGVYVTKAGARSVAVINGDLTSRPNMGAPSNLAAQQMTWTWSSSDPTVISYTWSGACAGSGLVTTVTCSGLTGGQSYSLSVTATNTRGTSNPATSSGLAQDVPGRVTNFRSTLGSRGQVVFAWSDPLINGAPITSFSWSGACAGSGNVHTVTCDGLQGGSSQTLTVAAANAMGPGRSASSTIVMPVTSPDPVNPTVIQSATSFTASWRIPFSGGATLVGYVVTVLGAHDQVISLHSLKATDTRFTQVGLTTGAIYTFAISATNVSALVSTPTVLSVTPKRVESLSLPNKITYGYGATTTNLSAGLSLKVNGVVTFSANETTLCIAKIKGVTGTCAVNPTLLNAGSFPITVRYVGDALTSSATAQGTLKITPATSTLRVATNMNAVESNHLGTLVVTVDFSSTIGVTPPGAVSLSLDGKKITTNASKFSFATWMPSVPLSKGLHTLTALYSGSNNYSPASASCKFVVR